MCEDWREQMKRAEMQMAEEQAQYELRSAEADKRWAEATERWTKTEQSIRSLLATAQIHQRKFEGCREANVEWREARKEWRKAGQVADERLRVLLNLVERQSRDGQNHKQPEP